MADTNQENFIELKEFKANDLELDDNEIEHLKTYHNNHIELETLPGKKTRLKTTEHVGQIVLPTNRIIKIIPKIGDVKIITGISPIKALIKAVKIRDVIISLIFIGAINRFVKFLLQISSKNNILKPMLVLNKKS